MQCEGKTIMDHIRAGGQGCILSEACHLRGFKPPPNRDEDKPQKLDPDFISHTTVQGGSETGFASRLLPSKTWI